MTDTSTAPRTLSSTRPHDLIITLYGLYGRQREGVLPISALIRMLGELGVEAGGVRSSVSRLKRRNTLESVRLGQTAAYRLSPNLEDVFREGDDRIFGRRRRSMQQWGLVAVSVPESERNKRHQIRSTLTRFGFGSVIPGLWIAPSSLVDHARLHLERMGLSRYAEFFDARYLDRPALQDKVAEWWNLEALESTYAAFLEEFGPVRSRWQVGPAPIAAPEVRRAAFADYVSLLTAWRRLPYLDPGLPLEFLPQPWSGVAAEDLFADLHHALAAPARQHAEAILAASLDPSAPRGDATGR